MDTHTPNQTVDFHESESYQRHQKQRFWQIIAPVGFGGLILLVILGLVIRTAAGTDAGGSVSRWADTALIWLALPTLLAALVTVLFAIMMIYLLARLLKVLPGVTFNIRGYVDLASAMIRSFADKLVTPIITVESVRARVAAFLDALQGRSKD